MNIANIAATNMEHLVDDDAHGYSWIQRWGDPALGICYVECEGHTSTFYKGDRDCSSAVIDSWQEALIGTPYEGALNDATYTGNMKRVFVNSGLFEAKPMSFTAQRGDIYLNEANHTAMCISAVPDMLAEFSISENGSTQGKPGDQTGWEGHRGNHYDYPWDYILHYNGKADGAHAKPPEPITPKIRVYTKENGWLEWVTRDGCEDGCGDDYAGIPSRWIYGFDAKGCGRAWVERADGTADSGGAGDSPITGIHLEGDVSYQVHWLGSNPGWGKIEHSNDDDGAGKDAASLLDMIRLV